MALFGTSLIISADNIDLSKCLRGKLYRGTIRIQPGRKCNYAVKHGILVKFCVTSHNRKIVYVTVTYQMKHHTKRKP